MSEEKKIITDLEFLSKPCEPVATLAEGEEIAKELFRILSSNGHGVGLAANQIGIGKRVCVVNVKEPLFFINPAIVPAEQSGKFVYLETCLSIPQMIIRTERWRSVSIKAMNFEGESLYDISNIPQNLVMDSSDAFEMAAIQHEIDHLDGMLMMGRLYVQERLVAPKYSRNDRISIEKEGKIQIIKFKQYDAFKKLGWSIIE